jgi:hypothetical protein
MAPHIDETTASALVLTVTAFVATREGKVKGEVSKHK